MNRRRAKPLGPRKMAKAIDKVFATSVGVDMSKIRPGDWRQLSRYFERKRGREA